MECVLMRIFSTIALALAISSTLAVSGCGRDVSRLMGREHAQVLEVAHMKEVIGVSFHKEKDSGSTIKDVTFTADDGYVYTQEFKDVSPLEGIIRWVPHGQDSSTLRTRGISRWTGTPVNYELPADCAQVLSVTIHEVEDGNRVKNLTFKSTSGEVLSKEYREGIINRQLEGWLKVKRKP